MICDDCLKATRDKCEKDISLKPKKECWIAYLEKIKEEINSKDVNCRYDEFAYSSGLQKAIEIIDNHIEELKGGDSLSLK